MMLFFDLYLVGLFRLLICWCCCHVAVVVFFVVGWLLVGLLVARSVGQLVVWLVLLAVCGLLFVIVCLSFVVVCCRLLSFVAVFRCVLLVVVC